MKLKIDKDSDALYLRLDDSKIIESEEVDSGVIIDFGIDGKVVAFELLNLSKRTTLEHLQNFQYESV